MKKIMFLSALLILSVCASSGLAQSDAMNSDAKMQTNGKKNSDSKFMMMAATTDMNEIGLSNQALSKSTNEEVKKMAQMMVDDHTKSSDELKPIAASKNVTLPAAMDAKHQAAMQKMALMSGMEFDMAYVKMMVKDHEKAVALFQKEADRGKDAEAKAFAVKTLPVIQGHLDMARAMMTSMSDGKKMDNNKMSGM